MSFKESIFSGKKMNLAHKPSSYYHNWSSGRKKELFPWEILEDCVDISE